MTPPVDPIASLMLDDLRRAASFLDELADEYADARRDQRSSDAPAQPQIPRSDRHTGLTPPHSPRLDDVHSVHAPRNGPAR